MSTLQELQILVDELNTTNSSNEKKEILKRYPECQKILKYIYNPFWKYGVTSKNCQKNDNIIGNRIFKDIFTLLNALKDRELTGHSAIGAINTFVFYNKEYEDLIWLIIDRNLKTRTDAKLINKVWKGLIPSFDVVLANKYDTKTAKNVTFDGKYFGSRKLDGVRVITMIDNDGDIKFYSRAGNEFTTLEKVRQEFQNLNLKNTVFDGEMCIINDDGSEDFTAAVSMIKRKEYTIENPRYKIFDMLTTEEFVNKKGLTLLSQRLEKLNTTIPKDNLILSVLEQIPLTEESFEKLQSDVAKYGWEGCMLRKDAPYVGKRTNDLLKVKKFFDAEYIVQDVEMGKKPIMVNGLMVEKDVLASVLIKHKDNIVHVGSGFSDEQRLRYYEYPEEIIGKTINVQYFEESHDSTGKISLRFPTIKHIYENGRDI